MYNRYVHNDQGTYVRITEPEPWDNPQSQGNTQSSPPPQNSPSGSQYEPFRNWQPQSSEHQQGLFQSILGRLHLADLDSGDLLLLAIMFLLFQDNGDEELLMALGLLLIL